MIISNSHIRTSVVKYIQIIIYISLILASNCSRNKRVTNWEPIEVPIIGAPMLSFNEEILYSAEPDSVWPDAPSYDETNFLFKIPDSLASSIMGERYLHILSHLGGSNMTCYLRILDTTATSVAYCWEEYVNMEPGEGFYCPLPQLPELFGVMDSSGTIVGTKKGIGLFVIEIGRSPFSYSAIQLPTNAWSVIFVNDNGNTRILVRDAQSKLTEVDEEGNPILMWEGTIEEWWDAAFYQGDILFYQKSGYGEYGHSFPAYLWRKGPNDIASYLVAQNSEFRILGITVVADTLFAVDYDGNRSRLFSFSIPRLLAGEGFRNALQDSISLDFLVTGPLSSTPTGELVGVSPAYSGNGRIVIMTRDGQALGQWIVPFWKQEIYSHLYDGIELKVHSRIVKTGPIYDSRFEMPQYFVSNATVWTIHVGPLTCPQ